MIWMILGLGPKAINAMNSSSLLFTRTTLGHELSVLDAMNNSGFLMKSMNSGSELRSLDAINNSII